MTDDQLLHWFPYVFPFFFVGTWLVASTILGFMSGWFSLQQWYEAPAEEPLLMLRGQSGSMGAGVALSGILKLAAYRSGLGIGVWRIFGPFQRPFLVPWSEIDAQPSRSFFTPMVKLNLGKPAVGSLKISARSWSRLVEAVPQRVAGRQFHMPAAPSISSASVARGMLVGWLVTTAIAAAFFYFASRFASAQAGLPLELCIGFPAVVLGIGQLIRYARQG